MQSNPTEIYSITSKRTGKSEQTYKDIGNFIFSELYKEQRRPSKLIIKIKSLGSFFLRRKRLKEILNYYPDGFSRTKEDFSSERQFLKYENKKEIYEIFTERLEDYEEYIKERNQIREIRYETQVLLEPTDGED
jgi:hypothetical protein